MSWSAKIVLVFLMWAPALSSFGQNQLVLFNREKILARFSNGDDFVYKRRNAKHYTKSFVTDLKEFAVVTFNDTVPFSEIDRVSLKGFPHKRFSLLSKLLITGGLLYFVIDQVNNIVVQGNKPDMNPAVWRPSLVLVSVGFALKVVHKNSQKIRYPARLVTVARGSRFYQSDQ